MPEWPWKRWLHYRVARSSALRGLCTEDNYPSPEECPPAEEKRLRSPSEDPDDESPDLKLLHDPFARNIMFVDVALASGKPLLYYRLPCVCEPVLQLSKQVLDETEVRGSAPVAPRLTDLPTRARTRPLLPCSSSSVQACDSRIRGIPAWWLKISPHVVFWLYFRGVSAGLPCRSHKSNAKFPKRK